MSSAGRCRLDGIERRSPRGAALSFGLPHTTRHATTATRLVLDLTHVVAAAVIVQAIAYRLGRPRVPATAA